MTNEEESQLRVALRVRPLNDAELRRGETQCAFQLDDKRVLLIDPEKFSDDILRQNRLHERQFVFDVAFGHDSTQAGIHQKTTQPLIDPVLNGYNATVFAYGATGSGKTYTMLGTDKEPGVMMRVTKELYEKIEHDRTEFDTKYDVRLSYLEVYNEVIRDLMNPSSGMLELREDSKGNIQVPGLSSIPADSSVEILELLQEGNRQRTQEPTAANQTSSRSHAVLQVTVKKSTRSGTVIGKLFMIDLAGSERASQTKNRGQRMKEGASINRSLLALGNVINSLSSHNKAKKYVNYRDSKLTRLLKDSLGGNSKTCMIAHVTPASFRYDETHNTLVYANRAKNITTTTSVNQNQDASTDVRYNMAIGELKKEIEKLKTNVTQQPRMVRSESSHQLFDRRQTSYKNDASPRANNDVGEKKQQRVTLAVPHNVSHKRSKTAPSEFLALKEQYLALSQEEAKIRPQLLRANEEAYDVQMSRISKGAILTAWDRQKASSESAEKDPETIDRLRKDVAGQESRMSELQALRKDVERELESLAQTAERLEQKMRTAADGKEQKDLVDMLVRMRALEAEKMAIESDSALLNKRMEKHDTSLKKVQKYGIVADQLIERQKTFVDTDSSALPEEFDKLYQEYRLLKNQVQYHMVPLSPASGELNNVSWNHQLLNRQKNGNHKPIAKHVSSSSDLSKTHSITTLRYLQEKRRDEGKAAGVTRFPPIMTLPGALSKDDAEVSYFRSQKQKNTSKNGRGKGLGGRRGSQASISSSLGADYSTRAASETRHRSKIVMRNPPNRRVKSPTNNRAALPTVITR